MEKNFKQILPAITTMIFDVDGVLTNNEVFLLESGKMARVMSIRDGFALKMAVKAGMNVAVFSAGRYEPVRDRLNALGIGDVFLGVEDKVDRFEEFIQDRGILPENVLYMGDDIPDRPVMTSVGLSACPNDAVEEVQFISQYISPKNGGEGCVRDIVQQILKVQSLWFYHH